MKKIYNYENAVITITIDDSNLESIRSSTKTFLERVIKEKRHVNINTTRNIGKETILN